MGNDSIHQLHQQLRTGQDKYSYYVLTAAASGIALAVNQTSGRTLQWSMVPLGLAILAWGASFYNGCQQIRFVNATIGLNFEKLLLEQGRHPTLHPDATAARKMAADFGEILDENSNKTATYGRSQTRFLIGGALLYLAWHLTEMALRTFCPAA